MTEDKIQADIVKWFNNNYCLKHHKNPGIIFSVPNGGFRNKIEAVKLKATGLTPGVSDLIVIYKSKIYFCELKTEIGVLTPGQKEFALRVTENGFEYKIFRSLLEFKEFIVSLS